MQIFVITKNSGKSRLYITDDGGESFHHHDPGFYVEDELMFHPRNDKLIITVSQNVSDVMSMETKHKALLFIVISVP